MTNKPIAQDNRWKLEDAKARFSEVVRRAHSDGPQRVTVRGQDSVVIITAEELARLTKAEPKKPLIEFMEGLRLDKLDLDRDADREREIDL